MPWRQRASPAAQLCWEENIKTKRHSYPQGAQSAVPQTLPLQAERRRVERRIGIVSPPPLPPPQKKGNGGEVGGLGDRRGVSPLRSPVVSKRAQPPRPSTGLSFCVKSQCSALVCSFTRMSVTKKRKSKKRRMLILAIAGCKQRAQDAGRRRRSRNNKKTV